MRLFISVILSYLMLGMAPARAQFGDPGGLGDILEDILKQGQGSGESSTNHIDNIPVNLTLSEDIKLDGHMLIISAYAPAERNGTFSKPRLLGETHLLLTGMAFPINAVIATPRPVTDTLDYTRLEARIVDENGNIVRIHSKDGIFRGATPASMQLVDIGHHPIGGPPPSEGSHLEIIEGQVQLSGGPELMRGGMLTLQLIESDLAGGYSTLIAAETLIDIDQKTAPFDFKLERNVIPGESKGKYALNAWITDWAGRKTHVMEKPVPYNGPDRSYTLTLDSYSQDPPPPDRLESTPGQRTISGEARFDAYKGLPPGSQLTATLSRSAGAPGMSEQLAVKTVFLDGLSGDVEFELVIENRHFDDFKPLPLLDVRITDARGRLFFSSSPQEVTDGVNIVRLNPSPTY